MEFLSLALCAGTSLCSELSAVISASVGVVFAFFSFGIRLTSWPGSGTGKPTSLRVKTNGRWREPRRRYRTHSLTSSATGTKPRPGIK